MPVTRSMLMRWRLSSCVNQQDITTIKPCPHLRLLLPRDASASFEAAGFINGSADSLTLAAAAVFLLCTWDVDDEAVVSFDLATPRSLAFRRAEEGGCSAADWGAGLELLPALLHFLGGGEGHGAHPKSGEQGEDEGIIGASSSVILPSSSS
jgi:hypothetical protein